jgi:hypothetical protein
MIIVDRAQPTATNAGLRRFSDLTAAANTLVNFNFDKWFRFTCYCHFSVTTTAASRCGQTGERLDEMCVQG